MQKTKLLLNILALFLCILPAVSMAQGGGNVTVSGIVTSADDKQPLIGVNVISGATSGVSTLADGTYRITVSAGTTLTFQYIGYKPFEFTVPAGRSSVTCDVALQGDSQTLDDVVVIAYGVRKKGTIAGSVSTVKAEKIEDTPAAAFDQALQGQVPGLTVLSDSGEPSEAAAMAIRGTNSINSGTAPLYILDGVAISSRDFNTINPSDIESLSVLKDASSTSIYGARAANGVIVITTKRGRMADRAKINYRMQLGFSQIAYGNWDLMNTSERIQYEKELGLTDGKNYNVLAKTDVNWLDEVFSNAALLQNYELSVSGASEKTNYYVSGGYYSQDGTAVGSSFERYSIRANVEQRAAKWLKLGTNTMMNYQTIEKADDGEYTLTTPISAARFMLPYWNPHRADGSLASVNDGSWKGEGQNPLEWLKNNPVDYKKYKIISTVFAEATPIEGLTLRSQFGVDYSHSTGRGISYPSYAPNLGSGTVQRNSSDGMSLSVTNTITYRFDIDNKHMFTFLAGQEGLDYRYEAFSLQTKDQNNDKLVNISSSPRATRWSDTTDDNYAYLSFFGRAEYSYSDRYYADFSLRTDGSSRFGASNRWAGFWSVGFMWNLRNEKFMENSRRWLTLAQIAVSTGTSGNSEIPNYEHLALVTGGQNYFGNAGIAPTQPGNEELSWEKLWTTNVALHLGFWNRLNLDVELYNKKTTDMLMEVPESYADKGYGYHWSNVGGMVNRGVELSLSGAVVASKDFLWSVNANVSYNRNKMTKLYSEGLLDPEFSTQTAQQWQAKVKADQCGIYSGSPTTLDPSTTAQQLSLPPLTSATNDEKVVKQPLYMYPGRAFITDKCSDPVAAIRLLDMFYATEEDAVEGFSGLTTFVGWEGEHWEYTDDTKTAYSWIDPITGFSDINKTVSVNMELPGLLEFNAMPAGSPLMEMKCEQVAEMQAPYYNIKNAYPQNARFTAEESERGNVIENDLYTQVLMMTTKFIVGDTDIESGWEDYLASLEKIGLAELTEIKEAALARWNEAIQ